MSGDDPIDEPTQAEQDAYDATLPYPCYMSGKPQYVGVDLAAGESRTVYRCMLCNFTADTEAEILEHFEAPHP